MKATTYCVKGILLFIFSLSAYSCQRNTGEYIVSIEGERLDSGNHIVSFMLPDSASGGFYALEDQQGKEHKLQVNPNGRAWAIINGLNNNKKLNLVRKEERPVSEGIEYNEAEGLITFSKKGQPIFSYRKEGQLPDADIDSVYLRGGYIHPVYTPSKKIITDDYAKNHLHHHGIWTAWTKTIFEGRTPDFWNMGDKTGKVAFVSVDSFFQGSVLAGFSAKHRYVDLSAPEPKTAINETWNVQVYNVGGGDEQNYFLFDINITQTCASSSSLILPTYRYGGLGFRGREEWNGEENTIFLTSEGKDRSNGHATTARWCHIGGLAEGKLAGITIMSHPDNFRAPQPMRIHPTEPFFNFAPSQAGDWSINPGETYRAKYRFVVYDGEPDTTLIENLWTDYAQPLKVVVSEATTSK